MNLCGLTKVERASPCYQYSQDLVATCAHMCHQDHISMLEKWSESAAALDQSPPQKSNSSFPNLRRRSSRPIKTERAPLLLSSPNASLLSGKKQRFASLCWSSIPFSIAPSYKHRPVESQWIQWPIVTMHHNRLLLRMGPSTPNVPFL